MQASDWAGWVWTDVRRQTIDRVMRLVGEQKQGIHTGRGGSAPTSVVLHPPPLHPFGSSFWAAVPWQVLLALRNWTVHLPLLISLQEGVTLPSSFLLPGWTFYRNFPIHVSALSELFPPPAADFRLPSPGHRWAGVAYLDRTPSGMPDLHRLPPGPCQKE